MAKLKNPLLSFDAHGSLGDGLTFRRHAGGTVAEKKPRMPYFLTLPVQYRRWLYQDYAYLWTKQSVDTKQFYATAGSRHHLTGFQFWLKYCLTDLPGIVLMCYFDSLYNGSVYDHSHNANHGTNHGATPVDGRIAGSFNFDGVNDWCTFPYIPAYQVLPDFSLEFFIYRLSGQSTTIGLILYQGNSYRFGILDPGQIYFNMLTPSGWKDCSFTYVIPVDHWTHVFLRHWHTVTETRIAAYFNGLYYQTRYMNDQAGPYTAAINLGSNVGVSLQLKAHLDHLVLYDHLVDTELITRHSQRLYPPK